MTQEDLIEKILSDLDSECVINSEDEDIIKEILENRINQYFKEN